MPTDAENFRNAVAAFLRSGPGGLSRQLPLLVREVAIRLAGPARVPARMVASWVAPHDLQDLSDCWRAAVDMDWSAVRLHRDERWNQVAPFLDDRSDQGLLREFDVALRDELALKRAIDALFRVAHGSPQFDDAAVLDAAAAVAEVLRVEPSTAAVSSASRAIAREIPGVPVGGRVGTVLRLLARELDPEGPDRIPPRLSALADRSIFEGTAWVLVATAGSPDRVRLRVRLERADRLHVVTPHVVNDPGVEDQILSTFRIISRLCGPLTTGHHVAIWWSVETNVPFAETPSLTLGMALALASFKLGPVPEDLSFSGIVRVGSATVQEPGHLPGKTLAARTGRIVFGGRPARSGRITQVSTLDEALEAVYSATWRELRETRTRADHSRVRAFLAEEADRWPAGMEAYVHRPDAEREIDRFLALGEARRPICVLSGESGTGRSALVHCLSRRHLAGELPRRGGLTPLVVARRWSPRDATSASVDGLLRELAEVLEVERAAGIRDALRALDEELLARERYAILILDDAGDSPELLRGVGDAARLCQELGLARFRFLVVTGLDRQADGRASTGLRQGAAPIEELSYRTAAGRPYVRLHDFSGDEIEEACSLLREVLGPGAPESATDVGSGATQDLLRYPPFFRRASEALVRLHAKEGASMRASLGELAETVRRDIVRALDEVPDLRTAMAVAVRDPREQPSLSDLSFDGPAAHLVILGADLLATELARAGSGTSPRALLREVRKRLPAPSWYRQALRQALRTLVADDIPALTDLAWALFTSRDESEALFAQEALLWLWDLSRARGAIVERVHSLLPGGRLRGPAWALRGASRRNAGRMLQLITDLVPPEVDLLEFGIRLSLETRAPGAGLFLQRAIRSIARGPPERDRFATIVASVAGKVVRTRTLLGLRHLLMPTFVLLSEISTEGTPAEFDAAVGALRDAWAGCLAGFGRVMGSGVGRRLAYRPFVWGIRSMMGRLPSNNYVNWPDFAAVLRLPADQRLVALELVDRLSGGPMDPRFRQIARSAVRIPNPFVMSLNEMALAAAAASGSPFPVLDFLEDLFEDSWRERDRDPWSAAALQSVVFSYCKIISWIPLDASTIGALRERHSVLTGFLRREVTSRDSPRGRYATGKGTIQSPGINRYLIVREQLDLALEGGTPDLVADLIECAFEPTMDGDLAKLLIAELQVVVTEHRRWHLASRYLLDLSERLHLSATNPATTLELRREFAAALAHMHRYVPERVEAFLAGLPPSHGWGAITDAPRRPGVEEEALSLGLEGMVYRLLSHSGRLRGLVQSIYRAAFRGDHTPSTFMLAGIEILAGHLRTGASGIPARR